MTWWKDGDDDRKLTNRAESIMGYLLRQISLSVLPELMVEGRKSGIRVMVPGLKAGFRNAVRGGAGRAPP